MMINPVDNIPPGQAPGFFFQAEDGIRDGHVTEFRRVLFRSFVFELTSQMASGGLLIFVIEIAALFMITMACVLVVQGVRKIPIQFAKRMVGRSSNIPIQGARDYIPLKVAAAGVMPIIFAQALMFLPSTISQYFMGEIGRAHV